MTWMARTLFVGAFVGAALLASGIATTARAQEKGAIDEVKKTIEQVVTVNAQFVGDEKQQQRRAELRKVIQPRFDFDEMARRSLGAHWLNITPEEQKDFVQVFSDLLAQTYLARVETVRSDTVKVDSENLDFPRSIVKTTVFNKGEKFPLDYKLMNTQGEWKVYDVVIENIGLVANYRTEFAAIIRKDQFPGLMQKLREKLANKQS